MTGSSLAPLSSTAVLTRSQVRWMHALRAHYTVQCAHNGTIHCSRVYCIMAIRRRCRILKELYGVWDVPLSRCRSTMHHLFIVCHRSCPCVYCIVVIRRANLLFKELHGRVEYVVVDMTYSPMHNSFIMCHLSCPRGYCILTTVILDASKKSGSRLVGDVDFEQAKAVAAFITPVPGGWLLLLDLLHVLGQST